MSDGTFGSEKIAFIHIYMYLIKRVYYIKIVQKVLNKLMVWI